MNIEPIGERVLLEPIEKEEKTQSGIYIPESAQEDRKEGKVVAVGQKEKGEFPVQPGDRILYGGYSNEEFEYDGKKYIVVELKDVIAKVR